MRAIGYLFFAVCLLGCTKEHGVSISIDPAFLPYFESFRAAGEVRGVKVNFELEGIQGVFGDVDDGVSAQCQHRTGAADQVVIDRAYWNMATTIEREFLIFHELGHCYLNRGHLDDRTPQGHCLSIMHSSAQSCNNNYDVNTREKFWDELFSD